MQMHVGVFMAAYLHMCLGVAALWSRIFITVIIFITVTSDRPQALY